MRDIPILSLRLGVVLVALVLIVAACAPPATPEPTAVPPTDAPTETPTEESSAADFPTPTVEVFEAMPEATDEPPQAIAAVTHADAPASPDAYRFDDSDLVGATGSPQLVEFFTTW